METLKLNFPGIWPIKTHDPWAEGVYIRRDMREVIVSCFFWWKYSGESRVCGIAPSFENLNISQYLRGEAKLENFVHDDGNVRQWEVDKGMFSDPIGFYNWHIGHGNIVVDYSTLVEDPIYVMRLLAVLFDLPRPKGKVVKNVVGHHPTGKGARWKEYLNDEDLKLMGDL
jgi:hypothetical protein